MRMILEGSNSAEALSPSGGGIGSHLLSLWDGRDGLVFDFFAFWIFDFYIMVQTIVPTLLG